MPAASTGHFVEMHYFLLSLYLFCAESRLCSENRAKELAMKRRVGVADRVIRVIIAIIAAIAAFLVGAGTAWGIVLFIVGLAMLGTGLSGYCPIYSVFKIETISKKGKAGHRMAH